MNIKLPKWLIKSISVFRKSRSVHKEFSCSKQIAALAVILISTNTDAALRDWNKDEIADVLNKAATAAGSASDMRTRSLDTYTFTLKVMDSTPRFADGPKTKSRTFKLTVGALPPPVKILWDSSEIDQIKNDIDSIVGRLESTLNDTGGLQVVASRAKSEFSAITDTEDLQQLIDDMFGYIQQTISDERTALADFMGGNPGDCVEPTPCAQFRSDWLSLLDVLPELFEAARLDPERLLPANVDLPVLRATFEAAPGRALYPLYRLLNSDSNLLGDNFVEDMQNAIEAASFLSNMISVDLTPANPSIMGTETETGTGTGQSTTCNLMLQDSSRTLAAISLSRKSAVKWRYVSAMVDALEAAGAKEMETGVHGYVNVNWKFEFKPIWILQIATEGFKAITGYAQRKLIFCTTVQQQESLMDLVITNTSAQIFMSGFEDSD